MCSTTLLLFSCWKLVLFHCFFFFGCIIDQLSSTRINIYSILDLYSYDGITSFLLVILEIINQQFNWKTLRDKVLWMGLSVATIGIIVGVLCVLFVKNHEDVKRVFPSFNFSNLFCSFQLFNLEVMPSGLDDYGLITGINVVELAHVGLELFLYGGTLAMAKCN